MNLCELLMYPENSNKKETKPPYLCPRLMLIYFGECWQVSYKFLVIGNQSPHK